MFKKKLIINKKTIIKLLSILILFISFSCTKKIFITQRGIFLIPKDRNRVPFILFRHKVKKFFEDWYNESRLMQREELKDFDSLTYLGYAIYESFVSKYGRDTTVKYFIVPDNINVILLKGEVLDTNNNDNFSEEKGIIISKKINNFRPRVKNINCLYYTDKYKKVFEKFSLKYGVKPYVMIDSPLMRRGYYRHMETSPLVYAIKIYEGTHIVSIVYSYCTSEFETLFKYENNKLQFLKHRWEFAID